MLKPLKRATSDIQNYQPPSGGCVLKLRTWELYLLYMSQPPSGGCVLKQELKAAESCLRRQPPSGGCVLKQHYVAGAVIDDVPAAFGRLCVETRSILNAPPETKRPAAFGRLCVETSG